MQNNILDDAIPVTWKTYLVAAAKFLIIFYIATFCLGLLFLHRGENWLLPGAVIGLAYLVLIMTSAIKMVRKLSMAAIMVASPTIPLCMLIIVVSLLPTLQVVNQHLPQGFSKQQATLKEKI